MLKSRVDVRPYLGERHRIHLAPWAPVRWVEQMQAGERFTPERTYLESMEENDPWIPTRASLLSRLKHSDDSKSWKRGQGTIPDFEWLKPATFVFA